MLFRAEEQSPPRQQEHKWHLGARPWEQQPPRREIHLWLWFDNMSQHPSPAMQQKDRCALGHTDGQTPLSTAGLKRNLQT